MIGHGGTETLLYCHLAGVPINRQYDQPPANGGNWFGFDRATRHLLHAGWQLIGVKILKREAAPVADSGVTAAGGRCQHR